MEASMYKNMKTQRGILYHYFHSPARGSKPTLLFIHGFPSSSRDWHHQVTYFKANGYGLVVPDLLGYGGTDKPLDPKEFRMALMAADIIDILDAEHLEQAVIIGHDWGCALVSMLSMLHSQRFLGLAWLTLSFTEPGPEFNVDALMAYMKQTVGYEVFGYWKFFEQDDAASKIEDHIDSFIDMMYPKDAQLWRTVVAIPPKSQEWVEQGQRTERAAYLNEEDYKRKRETFLENGLSSPLNWYKCYLGNYNREDHLNIRKESWTIKKPAFFGGALKDVVNTAAGGKAIMRKYAENVKVVEFDTGHWLQLEQPDKLNRELESWIADLS